MFFSRPYKGYVAQVEFDDEAEVFHGQVINTGDGSPFRGPVCRNSARSLRTHWKFIWDFVENSIRNQRNRFPESSCCGFLPRFTAKPSGAKGANKSLNAWISECIEHHARVA